MFSGIDQSKEDIHFRRVISSFEKQCRLDIIECLRKCIKKSLMASTNGSISYRLSENLILITPSGFDRSKLEVCY